MRNMILVLVLCSVLITDIQMFVLQGKFISVLDNTSRFFAVPNRGYYNETEFRVKLACKTGTRVKIGWLLRDSECADEFYLNTKQLPADIFSKIYHSPNIVLLNYPNGNVWYERPPLKEYVCDPNTETIDIFNEGDIKIVKEKINSMMKSNDISPMAIDPATKKRRRRAAVKNATVTSGTSSQIALLHDHKTDECITKTWREGSFLFILYTEPVNNNEYSLKMTLDLVHKNGYLSANDWPLLPFYGIMVAIYSLYGLFWLVCSAMYWRDLLRLQLWIGAVIILGLMEKAAYLAEYETLNNTGNTTQIAMIVAEVISCFKRSLARMLVIIVSLGFGIVKPRLGPTMQKVVGLGAVYFVLAVIDGVFRIMARKEDTDNKGVLAGVPLVVIDVSACYWILCNLQQTMRTLKLRRNIPKLSLYRHFTNTLIFSVIASVVFMAWSLKRHRFVACLTDWKELWLDDAFWHILFSFIMLVIVILWRPSKNSQRFAFTPLLDNEEDADEMDDLELQENEVFDSVKMRQVKPNENKKSAAEEQNQKSIEDDLRWVEENVPATLIETAIPPMIDSDEELMTNKFEASKMD